MQNLFKKMSYFREKRDKFFNEPRMSSRPPRELLKPLDPKYVDEAAELFTQTLTGGTLEADSPSFNGGMFLLLRAGSEAVIPLGRCRATAGLKFWPCSHGSLVDCTALIRSQMVQPAIRFALWVCGLFQRAFTGNVVFFTPDTPRRIWQCRITCSSLWHLWHWITIFRRFEKFFYVVPANSDNECGRGLPVK